MTRQDNPRHDQARQTKTIQHMTKLEKTGQSKTTIHHNTKLERPTTQDKTHDITGQNTSKQDKAMQHKTKQYKTIQDHSHQGETRHERTDTTKGNKTRQQDT